MKRELNWQIFLACSLIAATVIVYCIHYLIFRDAHHIYIFLVGDIAFVFAEVLLVTLVIHRLLAEHEKRSRLEKTNMVIGAFFSEVGTHLLAYISDYDPNLDNIKKELVVSGDWSDGEFNSVRKRLEEYNYKINTNNMELSRLTGALIKERDFLLRLLENPSVLEYEAFTELLRSVFHLTEELAARENMRDLPENDKRHLTGDIERVYKLLVHQWLDYMKYLKINYPYLFSFAMRTNPFDQTATLVFQ